MPEALAFNVFTKTSYYGVRQNCQLNYSQIPNPQWLYEIINICSFKMLLKIENINKINAAFFWNTYLDWSRKKRKDSVYQPEEWYDISMDPTEIKKIKQHYTLLYITL